MKKDEGLGTKIWLEEQENSPDEKARPALHLYYKFAMSKSEKATLAAYAKSKKLKVEEVVCAAWALLLNKLATTESITLGSASVHAKPKSLNLIGYIKPVISVINNELKASKFVQSIKAQKIMQHSKKQEIMQEIRYLFAIKGKSRSKSAFALNSKHYSLCLIYDTKTADKLTLAYNASCFHKKTITTISDYFKRLLLQLCHQRDNYVVDMDIMSDNERKKVTEQWPKPRYPFEVPTLTQSVTDLIAEFAVRRPDKLAISHLSDQLSFSELNHAVDMTAQYLLDKGIQPQENVAVLMDRTPSLIIVMFAIFKIGAVFVPINPKYPNERIQFVVDDSRANYLIVNTRERLGDQFKGNYIVLSSDWRKLPTSQRKSHFPATNLQQIAYMIYTSGTTGKPKGVMIRQVSLTNLTAWYLGCYAMTEDDRASQMASQGFDTYICETVPILACGASVHIVDDNIKLTPSQFFSWLQHEEITIGDLPTAYAQILFNIPWPNNLKMRMLKIGGETCTRYPDKNYSFDIWNVYGPTETTIEATFYKMHSANQEPHKTKKHMTPSIGKILANGEIYIVDQYLKPVPPGVVGEMLIGGIGLSPGYFDREELTDERFIPNPFSRHLSDKVYRTGDLAAWNPDGNIKFIGRIDNQVKIRGYRVELGDIENVISKYPDVGEVAVIARENPNGEKSIIAYVVPNLDKERFLFQERCLLSIDNGHFVEALSEDISKSGIALTGIIDNIPVGQKVKLHLKLPGFNAGSDLSARLIWQHDNRAGFAFDLDDTEKATLSKCINYFLSSHNMMDLVLSASAKRSLRKALSKKLPEYMLPSSFVTLTEFPLTFSGKIDLKALPPPDDYEQILRKKFIPPKTETEKKLVAIWEKILGKHEIGMEDNFFDLGGNSLRAAELSVCMMSDFNISVPAQILFDLSYIPILAEYIDTRGAQYATQSYIQEEISRDVILPENIVPTGKLSPHLNQPENILLTGAGGFLGVFLLNELQKIPDAKIFCLIRKSEFETAAGRLMATIKKFGLDKSVSLANRRIIAIPSDLGMDQFGISNDQYEALAGKIDSIYHCGAQVNIMASYNKLRTSNVQGTLEVIKFATHKQDKAIHYISTLSSAYLKDETGALTEEFPSEHYEELFGGYAISKWVSERLLTELKDRGLPISIYRSGYISGDSQSGITSLNDALLLLIKGCIELGFAPDYKETVTILPVDFVSKAVVALSLQNTSQSHIYHIDHPIGIMWTDLVAWLNDYGYSIKILSMATWKEKLREIDKNNALYPFLPYYLSLPDNYRSPQVRTEKASAGLLKAGLDYPAIDDGLLNLYFDHLCEVEFIVPPPQKKKIRKLDLVPARPIRK